MKKTLVALALLALFMPVAEASACSGGFFFPCGAGYGAPREELVVYAWGPGTTAQSPYNNYQQPSYHSYYPQYQPSYYQPSYQYYQPYTYQQYYPQYSYNYPQYGYYDYYMPQTYGYGYGPQPMGTQDLFGNQLCDWGTGYRGYRCDYDPHQWILDPYTGTYY